MLKKFGSSITLREIDEAQHLLLHSKDFPRFWLKISLANQLEKFHFWHKKSCCNTATAGSNARISYEVTKACDYHSSADEFWGTVLKLTVHNSIRTIALLKEHIKLQQKWLFHSVRNYTEK